MLVLLEQSGRVPDGFSASTWTAHQNARVRHQAIRLQLTLAAERDQALRTALEDADARIWRVGLMALRQECPRFLHEVLARLTLSTIDTSENRQMRPLGVRFGSVGLQGLSETDQAPVDLATLDIGLTEEADMLRWMQQGASSTISTRSFAPREMA